jgi:agmatine deiminase
MKNRKPIPDWIKPSAIALVWPEHLPAEVSNLLRFYKNFITKLNQVIDVVVIYKDSNDLLEIEKLQNGKHKIIPYYQEDVCDIWVQDFGPIYIKENDKYKAVKAIYDPSYHDKEPYFQFSELNHQVGVNLATWFNGVEPIPFESEGLPLILDGGNYTTNGKKGIVSDYFLFDNHIFIDDAKYAFKSQFGFDNLHIVPPEPGDLTGHVDGMIRYFKENAILVAKYPDHYEQKEGCISEEDFIECKEFSEYLAESALYKIDDVLRVPSPTPYVERYDFPSAVGNYINYLRVGNKIFLPQYGIDGDKEALEFFQSIFGSKNIIPINIDVKLLAEYGGVLNCITCHLYKNE